MFFLTLYIVEVVEVELHGIPMQLPFEFPLFPNLLFVVVGWTLPWVGFTDMTAQRCTYLESFLTEFALVLSVFGLIRPDKCASVFFIFRCLFLVILRTGIFTCIVTFLRYVLIHVCITLVGIIISYRQVKFPSYTTLINTVIILLVIKKRSLIIGC